MDGQLRAYSRFLRRDFLGILVKTTAKELNLKTGRFDWRTRQGMMMFLAENWVQIKSLIAEDTFFNWFCNNYSQFEEIFAVKTFGQFIYQNWAKYGDLLKSSNGIAFLKENQSSISFSLTRPQQCTFSQYAYGDIHLQFYELITSYFGGKKMEIPCISKAGKEANETEEASHRPDTTCSLESIFGKSDEEQKLGPNPDQSIFDEFFFS